MLRTLRCPAAGDQDGAIFLIKPDGPWQRIVAELVNYKSRMLPFMPGQRAADKERAFFAIFSTMIGAVEIARLLPDRAMQEKVLASTRGFLLRSF